MIEEAVLLSNDGDTSLQDGSLAKILDFFGVSWCRLAVSALLADNDTRSLPGVRLLCSSDVFSELIANVQQNPSRLQQWRQRVHSVFVYAGDDTGAFARAVKLLGRNGTFNDGESYTGRILIAKDFSEFCGVMAGVSIDGDAVNIGSNFVPTDRNSSNEIMSTKDGTVFWKIEYENVPVFMCGAKSIVDMDCELADGIFDVRNHLVQAVPIVLYIRWAFANTSWVAPEHNACLIIDDPLLKPTYGFVEFRELLFLMRRYKFSTNIAFIPWNWRRSAPQVAQLFRENPDYFSVSVHGCAHTRGEFGDDSSERLYGKTKQALKQMEWHESATGISHDHVMVFPQGVFSEMAMTVLKRTRLIAAVNNDTISSDSIPPSITIADVWDIAIMSYYNFPLFTRRYPWQGIENFAFDSLLGKPVLIVIHHDFCRGHCAQLVDFVEKLNGLARPLSWRSLGEAVRRSCRQQVLSADLVQVEMYASELRLENRLERPRQFLVKKRECDPESIKEVRVRNQQLLWERAGAGIQFALEIGGRESVVIQIRYHRLSDEEAITESLTCRARTMIRRYLCELRDNYLHKLSPSSDGKSR